jgi:hypothetical protein
MGLYGVGVTAFDSKRQDRKPTTGLGFSLRLGEALTDYLDLGISFALGSTNGDADDTLTFGRFTVHSQWYLDQHWYALVAAGAASAAGKDPLAPTLDRGRDGDVYVAGVGVNLCPSDPGHSGGWVLSPVLSVDVGPARDFTTTSVWLGLEVSYWTGLTNDKLDLPIDAAYE